MADTTHAERPNLLALAEELKEMRPEFCGSRSILQQAASALQWANAALEAEAAPMVHRQGCPAEGGYGHGNEECICSPQPAQAEDGWMPIETAPRDGTKFLAYRPLAALTHDPEIRVVRGIAHDHGCWEKTVPAGCSKENFTDGACKPTHWRPLPAPPTINASGEQQQ